MTKPSDVLVVAAVVAGVIWLDIPKLLIPLVLLALMGLAAYRWRRQGREPMAAERYRARLVASCALIGAFSIPLIAGVVPPNGAYGFRTTLTLSNAHVWYAANAFMGWALLAAAIVGGVRVTHLPPTATRGQLLAAFIVPVLGAVMASFVFLQRLA